MVRLWDLEKRTEVRRFERHPGRDTDAAFTPDGRYLLYGVDQTMRLWDVETGKEVRRFSGHEGEVEHMAFSHDGRRALSAGRDGTVRLWDVGTAKELQAVAGDPTGGIPRLLYSSGLQEPFVAPRAAGVAFSPDDRQALAVWTDGTVRVWRLPPDEKK
jgi:WD40 repeat protein